MRMRVQVGPWLSRWLLLIAAGLSLAGCSAVYAPTGVVLTHFAEDEVVPHVFSSEDIDIATCGTGMGLDQLLASFGRVIQRPHLALMDTELLSSYCSEARANEAHLMYLQALREGVVSHARDFHIVEQRWQKLTAERRLAANHDLVAEYGKLGDAHACPLFDNTLDQAQYLAGLIVSLQALLSDIQAGSVVGVPQDIANQAARSSECLNNQKWWGMPEAIRAAAWLSVPGSAPNGIDPLAVMDHAVLLGEQSGMPLPATFAAIAAYGRGDQAAEETALRRFVAIAQQHRVPKAYAVLAAIGQFEAQNMSDQIWVKQTGARTPFEALGTFPDDTAKHAAPDTSNLLD